MPIKTNLPPSESIQSNLSSLKPQHKFHKSLKSPFVIALSSLILILPLAIYLLIPPKKPISPISHSQKPEIVRQALNETKKSLTYYLAASQEYLQKARDLSNQTSQNQTISQKKKIISLLNLSLNKATSAITHYSHAPQGYQQRAKVYLTLSHLDSKAKSKAQKDLEIAQNLSQGKTLKELHINPQDLVNTQPIQEASLNQNIAIALPEEKTQKSTTTKQSSNAKKGTTILKANQQKVLVKSSFVTSDNLIYFTPQKDIQNEILSLSKKQTCPNSNSDSSSSNPESQILDPSCKRSFTLKLSNPLSFDLPIDWWIVE